MLLTFFTTVPPYVWTSVFLDQELSNVFLLLFTMAITPRRVAKMLTVRQIRQRNCLIRI